MVEFVFKVHGVPPPSFIRAEPIDYLVNLSIDCVLHFSTSDGRRLFQFQQIIL